MKNPTLSFEFFPPKTEPGLEHLKITAAKLDALSPDYFSVTYGAGGSTHEGTLNTVKALQTSCKGSISPHLSCIGAKKAEILDLLTIYKNLGIKQLIVLRGDLPSGMGRVNGEFNFASDLVTFIREKMGETFKLQVAAYPEVHPEARNAAEGLDYFAKKVRAGADGAITQFFYNADAYFYFLDQCSRLGLHVPIVPGIMPITQFAKQARFAEQCGAEIPRWLRKRLESLGDDPLQIQSFATDFVGGLCERLVKGGAPGLHIYALNQAEASLALFSGKANPP